MRHRLHIIVAMLLLAFVTGPLIAQDAPPPAASKDNIEYSPYPGQDFPNRVFFGER